jgi:two-component sensor histidine kinase
MNDRGLLARLHIMARRGLRPGSLNAYAFAAICVAVATLIRYTIETVAPNAVPFASYFPAVLIATLVGGWAAGVAAMFISAAVSFYLFIATDEILHSFTLENILDLILFFFAAVLILAVAEQFRRVVRQLDDEEAQRQVIVEELNHRVKNKLATIYAILRHELRGNPVTWESVSGRLRALSAADDYLMRANGKALDLRQILEQELTPYDVKRISFAGDAVELHGRVPVVLALVIHELSTNAAKYGALSVPSGRLDISWHSDGNEVSLKWVESGGPSVTAPTKYGFGSNLIERSLNVFGGSAKIVFAASGVVCSIRFPKTMPSPETKSALSGLVA